MSRPSVMRDSFSARANSAGMSGCAAWSISRSASLASISPSPPASLSAAPSDPHAKRASAARSSAFCSGSNRLSSASRSGSFNGRWFSLWHRERIVGKSRPGLFDNTSSMAREGGSSSSFNSAFAAASFMSSAVSTTATRQPPAPDVMPKKPESRRTSLTESTFISLPVSGSTPRLRTSKPGCEPAATCREVGSFAGTLRSAGPWSLAP